MSSMTIRKLSRFLIMESFIHALIASYVPFRHLSDPNGPAKQLNLPTSLLIQTLYSSPLCTPSHQLLDLVARHLHSRRKFTRSY